MQPCVRKWVDVLQVRKGDNADDNNATTSLMCSRIYARMHMVLNVYTYAPPPLHM